MTYTLISGFAGVSRDADMAMVPSDPRNCDWRAYQAWVAAGNTPTPAPAPIGMVPLCQLWQLQAVLTAAQWTAVEGAVAAMNNASVSAFMAHGTNMIPANSTTLAALATAAGIDPATLPTLVATAAAISIP